MKRWKHWNHHVLLMIPDEQPCFDLKINILMPKQVETRLLSRNDEQDMIKSMFSSFQYLNIGIILIIHVYFTWKHVFHTCLDVWYTWKHVIYTCKPCVNTCNTSVYTCKPHVNRCVTHIYTCFTCVNTCFTRFYTSKHCKIGDIYLYIIWMHIKYHYFMPTKVNYLLEIALLAQIWCRNDDFN